MRFVDLFAGLGGFHVALSKLGHDCVFACEKDIALKELYKINYGVSCLGDIKQIHESDIPAHDILCAGFPCQPFSKAGNQMGLKDEGRGDLIYDIFRILRFHKPKYFILENVPNLKKHDREKTWQLIRDTLCEIGYDVKENVLSPHQFGIPQIRKRIFIVGISTPNDLKDFEFPMPQTYTTMDIRDILDKNPLDAKKLSAKQIECINIWQEIIDVIPKYEPLPGFPIWGMEFLANYPIENLTPNKLKVEELEKYKGAFGIPLKSLEKKQQMAALPSYASYKESKFPLWKKNYIQKNRSFLNKYEQEFKPLFKKLEQFPSSWQKFEWNCGNMERKITNYIIQFRASGIRVKKTNYSPALVLTSTQIPIIGWEERYLTLREASRLQGLNTIHLPLFQRSAYRALGNAVNVHLVYKISEKLIAEENQGQRSLIQKSLSKLSVA